MRNARPTASCVPTSSPQAKHDEPFFKRPVWLAAIAASHRAARRVHALPGAGDALAQLFLHAQGHASCAFRGPGELCRHV
ncbi:hypothetical protein G6F65_022113 [Rhizopus arrhizus]|nr:hypothetical protein G6F65_022113 [Rhizopus arrhizus]